MLLVYSGRHKSASTWCRAIIRDAALVLGLKTKTVMVPEQFAEHGSLGALVEHEKPDILYLTNARLEDYDTLPEPKRTLDIIRDPRDIVVSGYFSHRNFAQRAGARRDLARAAAAPRAAPPARPA